MKPTIIIGTNSPFYEEIGATYASNGWRAENYELSLIHTALYSGMYILEIKPCFIEQGKVHYQGAQEENFDSARLLSYVWEEYISQHYVGR